MPKAKIGPLTMRFKNGLRTDGEVIRLVLEQFDESIELTEEQAKSLAKTIRARFGD